MQGLPILTEVGLTIVMAVNLLTATDEEAGGAG